MRDPISTEAATHQDLFSEPIAQFRQVGIHYTISIRVPAAFTSKYLRGILNRLKTCSCSRHAVEGGCRVMISNPLRPLFARLPCACLERVDVKIDLM